LKRLAALIVILVFTLTSLVGCGSNTEVDGWQDFSNEEVSFSYPPNWKPIKYKKDANMAQMIEAIFGAPVGLGEFQPNVNLMVDNFSASSPSAEDLADSADKMFLEKGPEMGIQDYMRIRFENKALQEVEAGLLVSEYTIVKSKNRLRNKQLIIPLENKAYILTVTSEINQWKDYESVFNEIIDSVNIIN